MNLVETSSAMRRLPLYQFRTRLRGFAKKKIPKIRDYYGSGWVGTDLSDFVVVENRPKIALNQC